MQFYYPIFGLFLIFVIWLAYERAKATKTQQKQTADFWERESVANNTRKKSLDDLSYITIPDDIFLDSVNESYNLCLDDQVLNNCNQVLSDLKSKRIYNLTGKTSADIKLMFGTANINLMDEYDENFTLLCQTVYTYGTRFHQLGYDDIAIKILRFGIDSLSDISGNYKLLANLYADRNMIPEIKEIRETASRLDSLMKNPIIKMLDETLENCQQQQQGNTSS